MLGRVFFFVIRRCKTMLGKLILLALAGSGSWLYYKHHQLQTNVVPPIKDGYFGPGKPKPDDKTIRPFKIAVDEAVLKDLKR